MDICIPEIYCLFFHNNICHVCKVKEELMICSQCKTIAYCSKSHQKLDWKIHKKLCKAMTVVNEKTHPVKINNFDEFVELKKLRYKLLERELGRKLQKYEMAMWMYPRVCDVCLTENVTLDCPKCKSVFFCSEDHRKESKKQHEIYCEDLQMYLEINLKQVVRDDFGDSDIEVSYIPDEIQELPNTISDLLILYDKHSSNCDIKRIQKLAKFNCLSPVCSILFGLEKFEGIKNRLFHKQELNVHIVGAELYEMSFIWKHMFELAFHWIKNLTKLEYSVIGPELNHNDTIDKFTEQLCNNCKSRNLTTRCTFYTQLYHNIFNNLTEPDVIICFNSGIHVNGTKSSDECIEPEHSWGDSINYILNCNVPLILTAYTLKEIVADIKEIKRCAKDEVVIVVEPKLNPFCDGRPNRDFESQTDPIFFANGYIAMLLKNKLKSTV